MTEPANAAPAPAAPQGDFAETAALIRQIATEARTSGKSLTFDPDAPVDDAGDGGADDSADAGDDAAPATETAPKPKAKAATEESDNEAEHEGDEGDEGDEGNPEGQGGDAIDLDQVQAALTAQGGVDLIALAAALKIKPEQLKLSPGQAKAMRIERRKTQQTLERATKLSKELEEKYGDQVRARKAAGDGDLQPAIEFIENTFGMGWNDLNRMIADLLQGKKIEDLDQKRELRELRRREEQRTADAKKREAEAAQQQRVVDAKKWIAASIKGDKLADAALNDQLEAAGMPTVVDMVFEEMQANYAKGLTDPKRALERVKAKLEKHARALQAAGVLPKTKPKPRASVTASPPRAEAQKGSAGNGRDMTDAELRRAVLKEAGLLR